MSTDSMKNEFSPQGLAISFSLLLVLLLPMYAVQAQIHDLVMVPDNPVQGQQIHFSYYVGNCDWSAGEIDVNVDGSIVTVDMIGAEVCIPVPAIAAEVEVPGLAEGPYQLRIYRVPSHSVFPVDPSERTLLHSFDFEVRGLQVHSIDTLSSWSKSLLALLLILTVYIFGFHSRRPT